MPSARSEIPRPDPGLHSTGSEGPDGNRGKDELELLEHFGMRPSSDILDVGCGIGRLAYECASYLDADATYTGLDIEPVVIEWLNVNYASRLPGFRFDLLDVYGGYYRPPIRSRLWRGRRRLSPRPATRRAARAITARSAAPSAVAAEHARFPYDDDCFDVVCAFEVFMHMSQAGVQNYLHEIARVLRPGGLAVVTLVAVHPGEDDLRFEGRPIVRIADDVYSRNPSLADRSMAYGVGLFRSMLHAAGLDEIDMIKGRIHIPKDSRPGIAPGIEIPPLSHACDLFAARKGTQITKA
jgi:SAM-dependent methyltransferase